MKTLLTRREDGWKSRWDRERDTKISKRNNIPHLYSDKRPNGNGKIDDSGKKECRWSNSLERC